MPRETFPDTITGTPDTPAFAIQVGWGPVHEDSVDVTAVVQGEGHTILRALYGSEADLERYGEAMWGLVKAGIPAEAVKLIEEARAGTSIVSNIGMGKAMLDVLEGTVAVPYKSIHVHLGRRGINALIRTLRKARDATFGSDE